MNYGSCQEIFTISAIMKAGRKHYITPSHRTMIDLLNKYHDRNISERTHYRDIKRLEDEGFITRQARWNTINKLNPRRKSSIISLTIKGARWLVNKGNAWAGQILGAMIKWAKKRDNRFPQYQKPQNELKPISYEEELNEIYIRATKLGYV